MNSDFADEPHVVGEPPTPELLLKMENGHLFELIDGKLVARNTGARASGAGAALLCAVAAHVRAHQLGHVFAADCGYQIFAAEANRVRYVRGSFIARGRFPDECAPAGHVRMSPDLAIDAVAPADTAEQIETRRLDFLRAGTRLLWVIYPESRTVHVCRQGCASALAEGDELNGADVLPGFICQVADIFKRL